MKLVFCLFKYFPYGGLQRDFLRIALECQRRGHQIDVFTLEWKGEIPKGISVSILPRKGLSNHGRCKNFSDLVSKKLIEIKPDVVIGFNKMAGLDVYFAADPCYRQKVVNRSLLYRLGARYRIYCALEGAVFSPPEAAEILLLSEAEIPHFQKWYNTPREKFHLVPPGISRDRLVPPNGVSIRRDLRRELGLSEVDQLVLMVGSGYKTKGLDRALRALAGLAPALRHKTHLCVVGQGQAKPFLKLARQLGVQDYVHLMGARDDVPRFLFAADLLLHPSYTEAAGMVLLEAMAAGLPVLVTDVCGYAFHVENAGAGQLIPSPFEQATMNRMLEEMLLSEARPRWSSNGRSYIENTDVFSLPERAADIIEDVGRRKRNSL